MNIDIAFKHLPSTYLHGQGDAFSSQGVGNEITAYRTGDIYYQCPLFEGLTILKGQPLPSFDSSFSRMSGESFCESLTESAFTRFKAYRT